MTAFCVCKDSRIIKIEDVKLSDIISETFQVVAKNGTYIFPLNNLVYCELIGEEDKA